MLARSARLTRFAPLRKASAAVSVSAERLYSNFMNNKATLKTELDKWTPHAELKEWVQKQVDHCQPDRVHLVDGSEEENKFLLNDMVLSGTLIPLNPKLRPNSYLARSGPGDVARVEQRTFICSKKESDAGPTNNWKDPSEMRALMGPKFKGCMKGRTMFVIPFSMGPLGSNISQLGVEATDSAYVVANMRIMTRMGKGALDVLGSNGRWVPCLHSVGVPLKGANEEDSAWPARPSDDKWIVHYPEDREIVSFGSGYGGNALLGKKCYALRIASVMARDEGWLAEHMLILKLTSPQGQVKYVAGAFPSACGKTNLAMLKPTVPGWKVECVGDDIAWMRFDEEGRLRAINPEAGFFGVAPGTSEKSNPNALASLHANSIFTNVAMTPEGDVWWEGLTKTPPARVKSWLRRDWTPDMPDAETNLAAHPNSRFTAPASQCPIIASEWQDPRGVPIDAILFGGRRSDTVPLVHQSLDWAHGTFMGASMMSEKTAAAEGKRGELRADPFAMLPFCGYNMADYFGHWLEMGQKAKDPAKLPKIFFVNWFGKDDKGKFLWPGFGENSRVLEWVFKRCGGEKVPTLETPIGYMPDISRGGLNVDGLDISKENVARLFTIKQDQWENELKTYADYHKIFGDRLPKGITEQNARIAARIKAWKTTTVA